MANIRFRLAKPSDAKQIAYVHLHIRDKYDQGFFAQVNYSFLKQYYKVMLNDPNEVIVCAEDENGLIVGFSSGSLDASKQMKSMRDNKFSFLWPLFTSAISNPKLIKAAIDVDTINKQIFKFHKINGAKVVSTFTLPDGRERTEMVYDLTKIKFRFI